jgi:hypothetical protein
MKNPMRRFLRNSGFATLFGFLLVFLLMEATVRQVRADLPVDPGKWPRIEIAQKLDKMDREVSRGRNFEVVFLGSSAVAGSVDPVQFTKASHVSSFNAAFAASAARVSAAWGRDVVEPLLHPQVFVVGVQSGEVNDNGPKNQITYRKFMSSPGYKQTTSDFVLQVEGWLEKLSHFLRYRLAFRTPATLFGKDKAALKATEVRKEVGARGRRVEEPVEYRVREKFREGFFAKNLADLSFGGKEYRSLVRLHRQLKTRGVELVLMSTPVTEDYYQMHEDPEGDRAAFERLLDRFQRDTGATVIDAANAFPTSAPFRDPVHLDVEARGPFSAALGARWEEIVSSSGRRFEVRCRGEVAIECRVEGF